MHQCSPTKPAKSRKNATTMKPLSFFALSIIATSFFVSRTNADIAITNFSLTETNVSFHISGTFPEAAPPNQPFGLSFVNPDVAANPGFIIEQTSTADFQSFDGTQTLASVATGLSIAGNYFTVSFENDISTGESISGLLNATWNSTTFAPGAITSLNVFWGSNLSLPFNPSTQPSAISGGTYLTSVNVVPEPSFAAALAFMGVGGFAFALARRRFKRSPVANKKV